MGSEFMIKSTGRHVDKRHRAKAVIYGKRSLKLGKDGRKIFYYGKPITRLAQYESIGLLPEEIQILKEVCIYQYPMDQKLEEIRQNYLNRNNHIKVLLQKMTKRGN